MFYAGQSSKDYYTARNGKLLYFFISRKETNIHSISLMWNSNENLCCWYLSIRNIFFWKKLLRGFFKKHIGWLVYSSSITKCTTQHKPYTNYNLNLSNQHLLCHTSLFPTIDEHSHYRQKGYSLSRVCDIHMIRTKVSRF